MHVSGMEVEYTATGSGNVLHKNYCQWIAQLLLLCGDEEHPEVAVAANEVGHRHGRMVQSCVWLGIGPGCLSVVTQSF